MPRAGAIARRVAMIGPAMIALAATGVPAATPPPPAVPFPAALAGAQAALAACGTRGLAVSVVVLASDLAPLALLRANGAPGFTTDIARRKAYTALRTGLSSHDFGLTLPPAQRVMPPSGYHGPMPPPGPVASDPMLDPSPGGVPIRIAGQVAGAIAVSGATSAQDEACARTGLAAVLHGVAG